MSDIEDAKASNQGFIAWSGLTAADVARAMPAGLMLAIVASMVASALASRLGLGNRATSALVIISAPLGFFTGIRLAHGFAAKAAHGVASAVLPSGRSTPSRADYSREDALLMQRDIAGALGSFEARIAADPLLVDARLRAADIYAKEGKDAARAEILFREVQRIPGVTMRDDIYASNRLVDLLDGPLGNTGRAIVELRRIVERFPGTRAAEEARSGLATLKARHLEARDAGP